MSFMEKEMQEFTRQALAFYLRGTIVRRTWWQKLLGLPGTLVEIRPLKGESNE